MHEAPTPAGRLRGQFAEAMRHIETVVREGLHHGFFECTIAGEVIQGGKRQLLIRAGKSHKFTIPDSELPR